MEWEDFVLLRPILQNMVNFCLNTHIVQRLGRGLRVPLFVNVEENYLFELNGLIGSWGTLRLLWGMIDMGVLLD